MSEPPADRASSRWPLEHIESGGLVIFPTDTLWALGCAPHLPEAVERLRFFKQVAEDKPLTVAVSTLAELEQAVYLDELGRELARRFLPGPLTLVARPKPGCQNLWRSIVNERGLVGIRVPGLALTSKLLAATGPLIAGSANFHGAPPAATLAEASAFCEALKEKGAGVKLIEDDSRCSGLPSTLVLLEGEGPKVIRYGAIGPRELAAVKGFALN